MAHTSDANEGDDLPEPNEEVAFHIHLVSDSTGETVNAVARACLVQFDGLNIMEHDWPLIRTTGQMEKVLTAIVDKPGIVLCTLVNTDLRRVLDEGCRRLNVPMIPVLEPIIAALGGFLHAEARALPGRQHVLDAEYFDRIDAMHFVLSHDDGQSSRDLEEADVILLGVSRTSKTPTCIYLANRGIRAANIPVVPGLPLPPELFEVKRPLIVGLTKDPKRLVQIRKNRLRMLNQNEETDYVDPEIVTREVADARRLYTKHGWPVINVSRRSIEETATAIIQLINNRREETA
ncbi:MAG: kinase/pyrophosphorylase [Rhodospirillales bacterium]|nr:kinase/pyrophosphorylase [Rhodospirillales bacterium]MCW8861646.1 kinase/pyrophosphorylase [Rhodospirillales bacterium]MCW8971331.1 kinase/pyrophosphorylase [Rhodospirillales bacterium]MCW9001383.1 kinase/pyrophosphorylase [Rhodospirillales bacterium]MCW9039286.1 kinase/pyrophosphorylase [Rhodospirillales bacterium]